MIRGRLSVALMAVLLTMALRSSALAQTGPESPPPTAGGFLNKTGVGAGVGGPGGPSQDPGGAQGGSSTGSSGGGSGSSNSGGSSTQPRVVRTWGGGFGPDYPSENTICTTGDGQQGTRYIDTSYDPITGQQIGTPVSGCAVRGSGSGGAEPAPPPPPPTAAEVWHTAPLPTPNCQYNPATTGLTGLATWGWAENPGTVTADSTIRGYTVHATADPTQYRWQWGDGGEDTSSDPGSPDHPAVQHLYRTMGDYTISCEVSWSGSYTFEGPGSPPQTNDLGTSTSNADWSYHVPEIRSVRVAP